MTTGIVSLEDIIDDVKKNIKTVFQNGRSARSLYNWASINIGQISTRVRICAK